MNKQEKVLWDKAFDVAYKACMDHVSFSHKGEYAYEVGKAFIDSIKRAKAKAEKEEVGKMNVINTTIIHYSDHDRILVHTNIPEPDTFGLLTMETTNHSGKSEEWVRKNFGEVAIKIIDRRQERG